MISDSAMKNDTSNHNHHEHDDVLLDGDRERICCRAMQYTVRKKTYDNLRSFALGPSERKHLK